MLPSYDNIETPLNRDEKNDIKRERRVISVWLGGDVNTKRLIRCIYCSRVLSEVISDVIQVTVGDSQQELGARAVIIQCHDCMTKYALMD